MQHEFSHKVRKKHVRVSEQTRLTSLTPGLTLTPDPRGPLGPPATGDVMPFRPPPLVLGNTCPVKRFRKVKKKEGENNAEELVPDRAH